MTATEKAASPMDAASVDTSQEARLSAGRCTCDPDSYEPHMAWCGVGSSRFTPNEATMRESVVTANTRAERLARRIGAAEKALKRGQPSSVVLALLGGAEDE